MKYIRKSLCIFALLCACVCANSFAMKKKDNRLQELKEKMACIRSFGLTDENLDNGIAILIEAAKQSKDKKIKSDALQMLENGFINFISENSKLLNDYKNNDAIALAYELSKKVEFIYAQLKENEQINRLRSYVRYEIATALVVRGMRNFADLKNISHLAKVYELAKSFFEKIINDKKSDIYFRAQSYFQISNIMPALKVKSIKSVEEGLEIANHYLQKGLNEASNFIKSEKKKENPDWVKINALEKTFGFPSLALGQKRDLSREERRNLFKNVKDMKTEEIRSMHKKVKDILKEWDEENEAIMQRDLKSKCELDNEFTCKGCGIDSEKLKVCGRCKEVFYCSRKCQKKDWKEHKKDCKK